MEEYLFNSSIKTSNQANIILIKSESTMGTLTKSQAEALLAQAASALEVINEREQKFGTDVYKDGDILYADIRWLKPENARSFERQRKYSYAFIKADGRWYSSGPRAGGITFTWEELINWLNDRYVIKFGAVSKKKAIIRNDISVTK